MTSLVTDMASKTATVAEIEALEEERRFTPAQLAEFLGINRSTCKSYLDTHRTAFPPIEVNDDNGFRSYGRDTVKRLALAKALRAKPFNRNLLDVGALFESHLDDLWSAYRQSNKVLGQLLLSYDNV